MDLINAKLRVEPDSDNHLGRMKQGGYAPGEYFCKCRNCKCTFIGDKRAANCYDCAMNLTLI